MIWFDGKIVADDALRVSVLDRTFEHGLGLFETLRTWDGRAPLLGRHLARLQNSARELGLSLPESLPDNEAVSRLVDAEGLGGDVVLRLTLTGGLGPTGGATLFLRVLPLPDDMRHKGAVVDMGAWRVGREDPLARHKSLNYWSRRRAFEAARALGFDETIAAESGPPEVQTLLEGSRTNLFVVSNETLKTPALDLPIVPGIMRGLVIEVARTFGMLIHEPAPFSARRIAEADEVFLTNSVRGIIPVERVVRHDRAQVHEWSAPGPVTQGLMILTTDWLRSQGSPPS